MTTTGQNEHVPARATMREWAGLAVLALPCILYSMDLTVLNLAVPQLTASMQPSALELLWIVDIYGFVLAGALIPMGVLGDRIGRRRLLMIGAAAFGLASILAAFSDGVWQLIVARALLGLAAATLAPSTLSLVTTMFRDPGQRTFAIGIWIASFSSGAAFGPVLGGLLLEHFWWGSVFLLNVPVMILLLAAAPCLLPEARSPEAGRADLPSAGLSIVAVLTSVLGVKLAAHAGHGPTVVAALATGLVATACFVARQRRLTDPLIDIHLFRQPAFSAAIAINMLGFFIAFGTFLLIAQYLQLVLGLSPLTAGLWSAPSGLAFVLGAVTTPLLARHASPPRIVAAGLAVAAAGLSLLAIGEGPGLTRLIAGYVVLSVGLAPVFTLATDLIVSAAPPDRTGAAAGVAETSSELGGALGIALLGSVAAAIYSTRLLRDLGPAIPVHVADAARETLGGVAAASSLLPADQGDLLLAHAQDAFVAGFRVAACVGVAMALIGVLATFVLMQRPARRVA